MSVSIAMVALGKGTKISPTAIQKDLAATFPSLPTPGSTEKKDGTFAFRMGDADIVFGLMPAPIPWSDLEGSCSRNWLWPNASAELRNHRVHVIVTVLADCEPIERLKLLTAATAALVETSETAVGVYWCDSKVVMPAKMFRDFAVTLIPDSFPLYVWVDFRIGKDSDGKVAGYTSGMTALGHMEFETWASSEPPGELRERFLGLAHYLLENGPVIEDGNTIGEDENERITVVYSNSKFGHKGQVMRLDYAPNVPTTDPRGTPRSMVGRLFGAFRKNSERQAITLDDLQGRWQMVSCGQRGNFAPKGVIIGARIIMKIEGNRYSTSVQGKADEQGTLQIDFGTQPVQFDQHIEVGKDAGGIHKGIIQVRKGDLEHCQGEVGQPRPTDFTRKRKDTASLALFKRI